MCSYHSSPPPFPFPALKMKFFPGLLICTGWQPLTGGDHSHRHHNQPKHSWCFRIWKIWQKSQISRLVRLHSSGLVYDSQRLTVSRKEDVDDDDVDDDGGLGHPDDDDDDDEGGQHVQDGLAQVPNGYTGMRGAFKALFGHHFNNLKHHITHVLKCFDSKVAIGSFGYNAGEISYTWAESQVSRR